MGLLAAPDDAERTWQRAVAARARDAASEPVQQMRRLAPLATGIDQLRTGIVQAITYTRQSVEQISAGVGSAETQLNLLTPLSPADPDTLRQMRREIETVQAGTERLHGYLGRLA